MKEEQLKKVFGNKAGVLPEGLIEQLEKIFSTLEQKLTMTKKVMDFGQEYIEKCQEEAETKKDFFVLFTAPLNLVFSIALSVDKESAQTFVKDIDHVLKVFQSQIDMVKSKETEDAKTETTSTPSERLNAQGINGLAKAIFNDNKAKGFWDKPRNVGELLMLMTSELGEALEAHRKDKQDEHLPHRKGLEVELADCLIRILDASAGLGLDIGGAVIEKLAYNRTRAHKHGKQY